MDYVQRLFRRVLRILQGQPGMHMNSHLYLPVRQEREHCSFTAASHGLESVALEHDEPLNIPLAVLRDLVV